ncbi:MAG: WD40/YVTN/BNR-like repeat-containing protein [Terriglobales bacterium]
MRCIRFAPVLVLLAAITAAAQISPTLYAGLHWRLLGPWRGGKATSVVGLPGEPAIYYMGTDTSGVWKTDDGGRSWHNISDSQRLTGIGALAAAAPGLLYVAVDRSGGSAGADGLYRSSDGGATLELVALAHHPVADVWLDPKNSKLVLAASAAGISRSQDGGRRWTMVLPAPRAASGPRGGAVDLESAPDAPAVIYAAFRAPFGSQATVPIYRSRNRGRTWQALPGRGLPRSNRGRVALAVAPRSHGQRVYAYMAQGVFRSDDGGQHWRQTSHDPRLVGGGQFFHLYVDPDNARVLYAMQTSVYRSSDGGATWQAFTGAPSGDDFNAFWMDPSRPLHMALAVDQGTEISMNGGHSWTSWYNQPTGQMYNVSTDNQFPFHLYASQQDSGTVAVPIRANDGEITYRDWWTTNGFESARITPDPLHPSIVYATGWFGSVVRTDHLTGQSVHVFERNPKYREAGSMPMVFLPGDPQTLLLGTQYVLATSDAGMHWRPISPDLTGGHGAITTIAPSPVNHAEIWAGTSDGRIQVTDDNGSKWRDVSPRLPHTRIAMIEPGQENAAVAFAVASRQPGVLSTSDNGRNWTQIAAGIPGTVHAIRQDPVNRNLLFAAGSAGVFVSFDRGQHWQSLELNLPASSVTDLQIKHNDLVISTYGRGLWSLDDIASLRQMSSTAAWQAAHLFLPETAVRLQWDDYTDTPLNPSEPHSANPPDGAIIDYYLKTAMPQPLSLSIYAASGDLVNSYSSQGPTQPPYMINVQDYWLAPPELLPNHAGLNRFVWNLRYPDPPHILFTYFGFQRDYFEYTLGDHAIVHNTPWHEPQGPMVIPGSYKLVLTAGTQSYTAPLTVKLDPRLTNVTQPDLLEQLAVEQSLATGLKDTTAAYHRAANVKDLDKTFAHINLRQARLLSGVEQADAAPGTEVIETVFGLCQQYNQAAVKWNKASGNDPLPVQLCGEAALRQNKKQ